MLTNYSLKSKSNITCVGPSDFISVSLFGYLSQLYVKVLVRKSNFDLVFQILKCYIQFW